MMLTPARLQIEARNRNSSAEGGGQSLLRPENVATLQPTPYQSNLRGCEAWPMSPVCVQIETSARNLSAVGGQSLLRPEDVAIVQPCTQGPLPHSYGDSLCSYLLAEGGLRSAYRCHVRAKSSTQSVQELEPHEPQCVEVGAPVKVTLSDGAPPEYRHTTAHKSAVVMAL